MLAEKRARNRITPQELAWLVATLPVWAILGQVAYAAIPQHWPALGLPYRLVRLLVTVWALSIGFFVAGMFLHLWRHRQRDAATATLFFRTSSGATPAASSAASIAGWPGECWRTSRKRNNVTNPTRQRGAPPLTHRVGYSDSRENHLLTSQSFCLSMPIRHGV